MVPVVGNVQCSALLASGSVTSNMMCAGLTQGGKDASGTTSIFYIFFAFALSIYA